MSNQLVPSNAIVKAFQGSNLSNRTSLPYLFHEVNPSKGTVLLFYCPDCISKYPKFIEIKITGSPWHKTGKIPVAWDLIRPVAKLTYSIIRIIASRNVKIDLPREIRSNIMLSIDKPDVEIFRIQNDSLIPDIGEQINIRRIIEPPIRLPFDHLQNKSYFDGFTIGDLSKMDNHDYYKYNITLIQHQNGIDIIHNKGLYQIEIRVSQFDSAAFAYEISDPRNNPTNSLSCSIYLVMTDYASLKIKVTNKEIFGFYLNVYICRVNKQIDIVPPQGVSLFSIFKFNDVHRDSPYIEAPNKKIFYLDFFFTEIFIGAIPIIGDLYDIGQLLYAGVTGKDFFGNRLSDKEMIEMTIFAFLPFIGTGLAKANKIKILNNTKDYSYINDILGSPHLLDDFWRNLDQEFKDALKTTTDKEKFILFDTFNSYLKGQIKDINLLQKFNEVFLKHYEKVVNSRPIEKIFSLDFNGFKNPVLAQGFDLYKSKKGAKNAIDWARAQRQGSKYHRELEIELGRNYRDVLKKELTSGKIARVITSKDIAHFDKYVRRIEDHSSLAKINKGFGDIFEIDHILEQRFFRNDPRISKTGFDELGDGMGIIVLKNANVANQIFQKGGGNKIKYIHTIKTAMLKELIPHTREAEFTVQQIWDAHAYVFKQLDALDIIENPRVKDMFNILKKERGENLQFRIPEKIHVGVSNLAAQYLNPNVILWPAWVEIPHPRYFP